MSVRKDLADKPILSARACARAAESVYGNVMVYIAIGSELDTDTLIRLLIDKGVNIFVPMTSNDGIITPVGFVKFGKADRIGNLSPECVEIPDDKIKLDFCITPLLGFNDEGYRIGYGKGCYDRFFYDNDVYKIGLAFSCQRAQFTNDTFDIPLDCCVTEQNVIYFDHASDCGKIQGQ